MATKAAGTGDAALKLTLPAAQRKRIKAWLASHGEDLSLAEAALRLIDHGLDWSDSLVSAEKSRKRGGRPRPPFRLAKSEGRGAAGTLTGVAPASFNEDDKPSGS
jgi:hypothetical protein